MDGLDNVLEAVGDHLDAAHGNPAAKARAARNAEFVSWV